MAVRMNSNTEAISLQAVGTLGPSTTQLVQFFPQPKASKSKSNWQVAKRLLRSSKPSTFETYERVPDYPPTYVPLHASFDDEESLARLLSEISKKDDQLQEYLDAKRRAALEVSESFDRAEEERDKFDEEGGPKPRRTPEDLTRYQDYVNQFLGFFLQSPFCRSGQDLNIDPNLDKVIQCLATSRSCPDVELFRRVAIDPNLIASKVPEDDNLGFADNGVALNQLARFLDIAVIKFLSSVGDYTDPRAVTWALDYLNNLLQSLISSMNNLNSFGWYGAPHIRIRKGTAMGRSSVTYPLQPPLILQPPPVVVVGTPPSSPRHSPDRSLDASHQSGSSPSLSPKVRDPVTGQPSPSLSPLATRRVAIPEAGLDALSRTESESSDGGGDTLTASSRLSRQPLDGSPGSRSPRSTPSPSPTRERSYLSSNQPLHGILKSSTGNPAISPPRSPNTNQGRTASSSASSPSTSSTSPSGRKRKLTPAGPPQGLVLPGKMGFHSPGSSPRRANMKCIEEDEREELEQSVTSTSSAQVPSIGVITSHSENNHFRSTHTTSPPRNIPSSPQQRHHLASTERDSRSSPDRFSPDRTFSREREIRSPPSIPHLGSISENEEEEERDTVCRLSHSPGNKTDPTPTPFSPSSPLSPPSPSSPFHRGDGNALRSSLSPPPVGNTLRSSMSPPPVPKDLPSMNVHHELSTLTNGEGRVSLLAILHAITNLPNCKELWSEEVGEKCFTLIQFCIDVGLPQKEEPPQRTKKKPTATASSTMASLQERRKRLIKQENLGEKFTSHKKPWLEHGKAVVEFSLKALIQCSTCSMVGCSTEGLCRLQKFVVSSGSKSSMHNKLIRNLKRLSLHSPRTFREAVVAFARPSASSCRKLFSFLHVVLQYCMHTEGAHVGPLTDTVVVGVVGVIVDRLATLDLSEESIQESVIREACDFLGYSSCLFTMDTEVKARHHLHMYIHRVALSVLLPSRPSSTAELTNPGAPNNHTPLELERVRGVDSTDAATAPEMSPLKVVNKPLLKQKSSLTNSSSPLLPRRGNSTVLGGNTLKGTLTRADRPFLGKQSTPVHPQFSEGPHTQDDRGKGKGRGSKEDVMQGAGEVGGTAVQSWRGLNLAMLHSRIQRLSTLLELSEPGTIPEAGMLASLVDLCDGTTVVARSMIFVECSLLVKKLRLHSVNQPATTWLRHNSESPKLQYIAGNLRKWAEAIGERLRLAELRQKNVYDRLLHSAEGSNEVKEEPVFPIEHQGDAKKQDGEKGEVSDSNAGEYMVSYALKMCACNLLLEVTRFLRELPTELIPPSSSISQANTPLMSSGHFDRFSDRKYSNASMASSDTEGTSHFPNLKPHLSHYGSSLSVEEPEQQAEYPRTLSMEDYGNAPTTPSNSSPRKNRTSVYLRITPSFNKGGVSRNTSVRRQSRRVLVSDKQEYKLSMPKQFVTAVSPIRTRRRSISSSGLHRSTSGVGAVPGGISNRRPSLFIHPNYVNQTGLTGGGFTNAMMATHAQKNRRQSMGAALSYQLSGDGPDFLPNPLTPTTPNMPHFSINRSGGGGGGGGGGATAGGTSLGVSLNIGLTKLKRSAQRAFRRHGATKARADPSISPSASPGAAQRKRVRRPSTTDSLTQKLLFVPSQPEETRVNYPWLDVVEHLILVDSISGVDNHLSHKKSCLQLQVALKKVYSSRNNAEDIEEEPVDAKTNKDKSRLSDNVSSGRRIQRKSSLGTIFIHRVTLTDLELSMEGSIRSPYQNYNRVHSLPTLATMTTNASMDVGTLRSTSVQSYLNSDTQKQSSLKQLSFADLNMVRLNDLLMGRTDCPGADLTSEEMVQLTIESESRYERDHIAAQNDEEVCKYIDQNVAGFLHVPFSTLVGAAPILHNRTFSSLKTVAWESLLSNDIELSHTAGCFFLLAVAKENEKQMKGFVKSRVLNQSPVEKKNAILRFKVLWECRYEVWSRMEERAQKKFAHNEKEVKEKKKTIGYSQLANPLGDQGDYLPLSPGEPVSVCTSKACADNPDKCYRSTKIAPVVHPKEISGSVHMFPVSGVSIPQEVGGNRSSSVVYKVDSDEVAGAREWEAVDPTLFPNSLLPLIRFLLFSLVPGSNVHTHRSPSSSSAPSSGRTSSGATSSSCSPDQLESSELARQVVWSCMVEDPRLFFRPLLNNFNKLYSMGEEKKHSVEAFIAETLEPFHIVLQEYPKLPSRAAHMLLNNFVGVILQHTDQPYSLSARVIHSVLTLVSMVTSSVQGLDTKLIKTYLKKESCYTDIMATARIRGVDRVRVEGGQYHSGPLLYRVTDSDMTFGHLIAETSLEPGTNQPAELSLKLLSKWYLVDKSTNLPVLSSLVVQDHYSASNNRSQHPTFTLHRTREPQDKFWADEMDRLFVFKMNEVVKVLFSTQLLLTGPEVEKTYTYSEYALPNYKFMHKELVELSSFPRKALTNVQHEAGPNAFQNVQLRASDVMLKGMWVRFVMQLIVSASRDYDWSSSLPLFMNVVNGSLLLHSEDHTILYFCLSTMLLTATKFNSIFKKDGYLMIVPALVQVYSLHMKNRVITNAIRFMWLKFYTLDRNHFISQFMAASSTLLSEEVASLSHSLSSTNLTGVLTRSNRMEAEEARRLIAKALFELNSVLISDSGYVKDELQIMRCCKDHLDLDLFARLENHDSSQCLTLKETALLAIVFAGWNPEAIRGMQVLVYLDHMMTFYLPVLGAGERRFITDSLQYLVKKCDSISKPIQSWGGGDIFSRNKAGNPSKADNDAGPRTLKQAQSFTEHDIVEPQARKARKVSVAEVVMTNVTKILYNPNRKDRQKTNSSSRVTFASPTINDEGDRPELGGQEGEAESSSQAGGQSSRLNQSRLAKGHSTEQRIFQLSRNALLSSVSEVFAYYCRGMGKSMDKGGSPSRKFSIQMSRKASLVEDSSSPIKISLDYSSVMIITNIVCQMLKQGVQKEELLQSPGLNNIFVHFLYGLDWTEQHFSSFSSLLHRLARLFKQLQRDSSKAYMVWDNLTNFITSLTVCIHHNPQLVRGQDQHLAKLKVILETLIAMQSSRNEPQAMSTMHKKIKSMQQQPLLSTAPPSFADAMVGLAVELIVITSGPQNAQLTHNKFRYRVTDLVTQKLLKENEDFLMPKIILPLCIQLGLRGGGWEVAQDDVDFFMQFIDSKIEIFNRLKHSSEIPDQVLRVLKVFCCSFSESFSMRQWTRVSQWIASLFMRKLSVTMATGKRTASVVINNKGGERGGEKMRASRLASASGSAGTPLEVFISFHDNLLSFFEDFVVHCRVPLLPLLQPILWKMDTQLEMAKQNIKVDNPGHLDRVGVCINRCRHLMEGSLTISRFRNRQQLLQDLQDMLKSISTQNSGRVTLLRSHTTVENNQRSRKTPSRRLSDVGKKFNLGNIAEDQDGEGPVASSLSLPRSMSQTTTASSSRGSPSVKKVRSPSSKRQAEKRPTTLSFKPTRSVSIEDTPSPAANTEITLHTPPTTSALSPSPRSALRKRSPDRRARPRFTGSMESLDEEEDTSNHMDKSPSPRHLPPPPRGGGKSGGNRSPKLGELGRKGPIDSIEYPGDVEEEDGGEDGIVLENSMTQTPSPRLRRLLNQGKKNEEDGSVLVNTNAATVSPYLTKKRVAFSSESWSESLSLPLRTVQVEVHYDPSEKEDDGDGRKSNRTEQEFSENNDECQLASRTSLLESSSTSESALLPDSVEKSKKSSETKNGNLDSASGNMKSVSPKTRSAITSGYPKKKPSLSQTSVAGDSDTDCLLKDEAHHRTDARDSPYQMWKDTSNGRDSKFLKSQSLDRSHTHSVGNTGSGSRSFTAALKEGTKFLYKRGQRSSSEQDVSEYDHL